METQFNQLLIREISAGESSLLLGGPQQSRLDQTHDPSRRRCYLKTIELVISTTGDTQLQKDKFQGPACQAASQALEHALGLVTREQKTAEFYQAQSHDVLQQSQ